MVFYGSKISFYFFLFSSSSSFYVPFSFSFSFEKRIKKLKEFVQEKLEAENDLKKRLERVSEE